LVEAILIRVRGGRDGARRWPIKDISCKGGGPCRTCSTFLSSTYFLLLRQVISARTSHPPHYFAEQNVLVINPIIYAEVSIRFDHIEELEDALSPSHFRRDPLAWEAAFLAGKCFLTYRKKGGRKHRHYQISLLAPTPR